MGKVPHLSKTGQLEIFMVRFQKFHISVNVVKKHFFCEVSNFSILMSKSNWVLKIEWEKIPSCQKHPNLRYLWADSENSKKFQSFWNFSIPIAELSSVTKIELEKCPMLWFWSKMSKSRGKSEISWLKSAEISWFFTVIKVGFKVTYSKYIVDF